MALNKEQHQSIEYPLSLPPIAQIQNGHPI